jgi:hypothetical protein
MKVCPNNEIELKKSIGKFVEIKDKLAEENYIVYINNVNIEKQILLKLEHEDKLITVI